MKNPSSPFGDESLEFPVHCHFKVICEDREGIKEDIQKALVSVGVLTPLSDGNRSEKGNYITYNLELLINSRDHMTEVDACIRSVVGVKMVL